MRALFSAAAVIVSTLIFCASGAALTLDEFLDNGSATANSGQVTSDAHTSSSSAVGGGRTLSVFFVSGGAEVELKTSGGALRHSQDSDTIGRSLVIWDGDAVVNNLQADGLGGIDLAQDAGNALRLGVSYFDYALGNNLPLELRLYDAFDPAGMFESSALIELNMSIPSLVNIDLPFASFVPTGMMGGVDFGNVGAIVLVVASQHSGFDLTLEYLSTNGTCPLVPDSSNSVIDVCGVCGGNGTTCLDCAGVPNGSAVNDVCGLCGGDGTTCLDCAGVPFGTAQLDVCGVCNGDGSSCLDCAGVPNGGAVNDVCGLCGGDGLSCLDCAGVPFGSAAPDRCGVCGGDESSCCICTQHDNSAVIKEMRASAKAQYQTLIKSVKKFLSGSKSHRAKYNASSKALYRQLLKCIGRVPVTSLTCEAGPACFQSAANATTVVSCRATAKQLHGLSGKIVKTAAQLAPKGGVCNGTPAECAARARARAASARSVTTSSKNAYRQTLSTTGKVPKVTSSCNGEVIL